MRPAKSGRLWHVALFVREFAACERFYTELLGMGVEWRPDPDNVYLSGGHDNLALHRAGAEEPMPPQRLDHIGFVVDDMDTVDAWHAFLVAQDVPILQPPKTHRDGARSFYCRDPDGNTVQLIYHPPLAGKTQVGNPPARES